MKRYAVAFERLSWMLTGAAILLFVLMALGDLGFHWGPS